MAVLEITAEILLDVLPVLVPFIPMYILSRKISENTRFKPRISALIAGWIATILDCVSFWLATFYLADSEKLIRGIADLGSFMVIAGMILIYIFIRDIKVVIFPDDGEGTGPKAALAVIAVFIPICLLLLHLGLGAGDLVWAMLWPVGIFLLSIDCFEVAGIFRKLKVNSWMLGALGSLMILAIPFFSIHDVLILYVDETLSAHYNYYGGCIALSGSLLFLIPGMELYREREMPELEESGSENFTLRRFLNNLGEVVGGSASRAILEGAVSGFRDKRDKNISLREDMTVNLENDWEDFFEFLLATAYQCVGPIAFECSKGISELDRASSRVAEVLGWTR